MAGCASSKKGYVYTRDQERREMLVRTGVVESVREVTMEGTNSGAGTLAGAAVGGVAGSTVGGDRGQIVGAIIGVFTSGMLMVVKEMLLSENSLAAQPVNESSADLEAT